MAVPKVRLTTIKRKKSVTYMLDYAVNGVRRREAVGTDKRDAQVLQAKIQSDLTLGRYDAVTKAPMVRDLESLVKEFLTSKKNIVRSKSMKRYESYFEAFKKFFAVNFPAACHDVRNIKTAYVKECFDTLLTKNSVIGKAWSRKTVNGLRTVLISMFNYGVKRKYLEENPVFEVGKLPIAQKGKLEFFSDAELDAIWKVLDPFWVDHLQFLVYTGLRKAEMINLKWSEVDLTGSLPHITVTSYDDWETKTGATRTVPLNADAIAILQRSQGKNAEYVFTQKEGGKIHPDKPYRAMKAALKQLKFKGDIHKLRHTFATKLVQKGVPLYDVMKLLGHSDIKSTQIYAHLTADHLKAAVDKIASNGNAFKDRNRNEIVTT